MGSGPLKGDYYEGEHTASAVPARPYKSNSYSRMRPMSTRVDRDWTFSLLFPGVVSWMGHCCPFSPTSSSCGTPCDLWPFLTLSRTQVSLLCLCSLLGKCFQCVGLGLHLQCICIWLVGPVWTSSCFQCFWPLPILLVSPRGHPCPHLFWTIALLLYDHVNCMHH